MSLREPAPGSCSARGRVPALYPGSAPTGHRWGPISSTPAASLFPQSTPSPPPGLDAPQTPRSKHPLQASPYQPTPGAGGALSTGASPSQPRSGSLGPGLAPGRSPPFPRSPSPPPAVPPAPAPSCRCRTGTLADTVVAGAPGPRRSRSGSPACSRVRHASWLLGNPRDAQAAEARLRRSAWNPPFSLADEVFRQPGIRDPTAQG